MPDELLVRQMFGASHEPHRLHARRGLTVGPRSIPRFRAFHVDSPCFDAAGERVQEVAGGDVVEVVRGSRPTFAIASTVGTRPFASGSRVYGPWSSAASETVSVIEGSCERASGTHSASSRSRHVPRSTRCAPDRDQQILHHGVLLAVDRQTSLPPRSLSVRSISRLHTMAWSRVADRVPGDNAATVVPAQDANATVVHPVLAYFGAVRFALDHHAGVAVLGEVVQHTVVAATLDVDCPHRLPRLVAFDNDPLRRDMDAEPSRLVAVAVHPHVRRVGDTDRTEIVTALVRLDRVPTATANFDARSPSEAMLVIVGDDAVLRADEPHIPTRDHVADQAVIAPTDDADRLDVAVTHLGPDAPETETHIGGIIM